MVDASIIVPRLWQGSRPSYGPIIAEAGYDVLVLCAREYQPASVYFPKVTVIHAPNDDNPARYPFTKEDLRVAIRAASQVVDHYNEGKNILITCQAGINRSGLVMAITLHKLFGWSGDQCIKKIREERQVPDCIPALSNPDFQKVLRNLPESLLLPGLDPISL